MMDPALESGAREVNMRTLGAFKADARAQGFEFTLDYEVPHAERYGPEGATYWAARRNR